jgi:hypothetical protein
MCGPRRGGVCEEIALQAPFVSSRSRQCLLLRHRSSFDWLWFIKDAHQHKKEERMQAIAGIRPPRRTLLRRTAGTAGTAMRMVAALMARVVAGLTPLALVGIGLRVLRAVLRVLRLLRSFLALFARSLRIVGEIARSPTLRSVGLFRTTALFV